MHRLPLYVCLCARLMGGLTVGYSFFRSQANMIEIDRRAIELIVQSLIYLSSNERDFRALFARNIENVKIFRPIS